MSEQETVLVLQGGGSLGAYECGVYKALARREIRFDVVAGTSIGAVNAAIITASKNSDPAKELEDFWLGLAETITPSFLPDNLRGAFSSMTSALYGNRRAFAPKWFVPSTDYFFPHTWPYVYDIAPLKGTLNEHVDFAKLKNGRVRLIVTSTDIQKGKPVVFDSSHIDITADHVLASAGYPFYGIAWTQINGRYLWDGSLLSNTPLREVIDASPKCDKKVYMINLFPRVQEEVPQNMMDVLHRARDIMHADKTYHNVRMSKIITRYLALLKEMHEILRTANLDEKGSARREKIEEEYHKIACERGAVINEITRIERKEDTHFLFEDADFSIATIKQLIKQGEYDADVVLSRKS
jgi:NTE family protein